ncbi:MAG: aldehyde dehydrogenase [Porticoccaceae bacterium]|nr:MAG: aldehyde dehydrogenase [Porticoccaceae bacterium]
MNEFPYGGYVGGRWLRGEGQEIRVEDPSSGSELARFPGLSPTQIESAVAAAREAFEESPWPRLAPRERVERVGALVAALHRRADTIAERIVAEAGCPRTSHAMAMQVEVPLAHARQIAELYLRLPEVEDNPLPLAERITPTGQLVQSLRRYAPVGVVAAISAYNFPFYTALWKVVPALLTGNAVILRPSPLTPLSALPLAEAAEEAELPPGVFNLVLEAGIEGGVLLSSHPGVDMIAFTGSSRVGVEIARQAAPTMKRLQLELGGKSAQIFLPDAVDRVVPAAVGVCLAHAGQGCALGTRLLVPEGAIPELLPALAAAFSQIRVGPADDPATQMGPVISAAQEARCAHFVAAAREGGGQVVAGGARPEGVPAGGHYFAPTLLHLPDNRNPAAQEEIFGPVVALIGYRDLDHAVAMANDSRYGLSGYVHGRDARTALDIALRVRSGTVNVNTGLASAHVSSGGQRMSGVGRERGVEGLRIYQQLTCINLGG